MMPCFMSVAMAYQGLRPEQIMEKIRSTELRETCGPVMEAKECVTSKLSTSDCQFTDTQHQRVIQLQLQIAAGSTAADFICRDNVEVFNEHKACLLRPGNTTDQPALAAVAERQCSSQFVPNPETICPPPEGVDCVVNVVAAQCGQQLGDKVRELGSKVLGEIGCAKHKRSKLMSKKEMLSPMKFFNEALSLF